VAKFLLNGSLYRGKKSVMWSVVEKTALAEAEVEYHDHTSTTIWVAFPLTRPSQPWLEGAAVVIWTTTPWTIPANRAVAYGADIDYALIEAGGRRLVMAEAWSSGPWQAGIASWKLARDLQGLDDLAGSMRRIPPPGTAATTSTCRCFPADFVSDEEGTGLVHIAPSHGADDFDLGQRHGLEVPDTVAEDGTYTAAVPGFEGMHVFKAAEPVLAALDERARSWRTARSSIPTRIPGAPRRP
jgi:isoleucyl-tRNA synthetase